MKNISIVTTIALSLMMYSNIVIAQCTVVYHPLPGFYPTPQDGIHPAAAGELYSLNVTVIVPPDTVIEPFPRVEIDSATVEEFIGFPSSFQYYYDPPSKWIPGDSAGCIRVYGVPDNSDVGMHNISIVFTAVVFGFVYSDTLWNYWQFEIKDSTNINVPDCIDEINNKVALYPNPANDKIFLNSYYTGITCIRIFDVAGNLVLENEMSLIENKAISISLEAIRSGFYFLVLENEYGVITEKLIISR